MIEIVYHETIAQPYANCKVSTGFVEGDPVDTVYLRLERDTDGEDGPLMLLLRPDEMAAIAYCATGVLWSHLMEDV